MADISLIDSHLPAIGTDDFTMGELADNSRPSPSEASLIALYSDESLRCRTKAIADLEEVAPEVGSIMRRQMDAGRLDTLTLVKRQISWGDWATRAFERERATMAEFERVRI